ncbi:MAG: hypothetical protein L0Z53_09065 [Acidobacteriales bacterium]|nr:hypothetical protein [Terriglobales bacterium]
MSDKVPYNPHEASRCSHVDRNNPNHVHTHACVMHGKVEIPPEAREAAGAALKLADELAEYLVESVGCNDACDDNCEHKQARAYQEARGGGRK